jgi:glutathione reductase (NADPH)
MWHAADMADKIKHAAAGYHLAGLDPAVPKFTWPDFKLQRDKYIRFFELDTRQEL